MKRMKKPLQIACLSVIMCGTVAFGGGAEDVIKLDREFLDAVAALERKHIENLRRLAAGARSIQLFKISRKLDQPEDPFGPGHQVPYITIHGDDYELLDEMAPLEDADLVKQFAEALLPDPPPHLVMCYRPGAAVRFLDEDGEVIHEATVCLHCRSTRLALPHHPIRITIDPEVVGQLIDVAGLQY